LLFFRDGGAVYAGQTRVLPAKPGYGWVSPTGALATAPVDVLIMRDGECEGSVGYPQISHLTFNPESLNPPCGGKRVCFLEF